MILTLPHQAKLIFIKYVPKLIPENNLSISRYTPQTQKGPINLSLQTLSFISKAYAYFLNACSISTATATVAPTIGLLPIPRNPIIST